jgi:flagellar basal body-associated protein FliL
LTRASIWGIKTQAAMKKKSLTIWLILLIVMLVLSIGATVSTAAQLDQSFPPFSAVVGSLSQFEHSDQRC